MLKKYPLLFYPPPWPLKDRHPNEPFKFHLNHAHCFILSRKNKPSNISFYEAGEGDDSSELMTWLLYQMKEETIENINRELLTQMLLQHEFLSVFFCKLPSCIKSCSRRFPGERHTGCRCPFASEVPDATYEARMRALEGRCLSSKKNHTLRSKFFLLLTLYNFSSMNFRRQRRRLCQNAPPPGID